MAQLILKSIAYYPQATAELPMSHKDLGVIDTDKPYKKLIVPAQSRHLYRLVDKQTGEVLKAQKLIRDHNDLKVYVGDVIVVELKDFFSFENAATVKAEQEPLYMVDAGEVSCISGLISPGEGMHQPEMYVLWEPGLPVQNCLNPNAMAMMPVAGLAGISGLTTGGAIGISTAVGVSIIQANLTYPTPAVLLPKLSGTVFAGPVVGQTVAGVKVSGLKVQAFDLNGNSLGVTDVKPDGSYELELTNANYKGALVLKVFDPTDAVTAQYMDEATGKQKAFSTLLSAINYQGDATKTVTVNITTLTNLAAVKAGAKLSGDAVSVPSTDAIDSANTQVAQKFLEGQSLTESKVTTTVNADGSNNLNSANSYGIALALLSQIENVSKKTTAQVADLLSPALTAPDANKDAIKYLTQASANVISNGFDAQKIQTMVKALGNTMATGSVSLSSNANPSVNLSTTAPDENSKLTATVTNFLDANNTKANQTFSNPDTYQWQSSSDGLSWTNIVDNAISKDFILTQAQVGQKVRVLIHNTDSKGFDEYVASAGTLAVKNVNQLPAGAVSIGVSNNGQLKQGSMLSIISNSLTDTDGLGTLSYQWQRSNDGSSWTDISGATYDTYTLTQAEVGKQIRLKASYTDGQGTAEAVFSVQTASVANVNDPSQGNVLVNGLNTPNQNYQQGDQLTATNTLSDPDNNGTAINNVNYQWQSSSDGNNWTNISGANSDTYTLAQTEVGQYVRVLAGYTDATSFNESKASAASAAITNVNDAPTGTLTITGTPTENQALSANTARLSDPDNNGTAISGMTYQWEQADSANGNWQAIANATSATFTPGNPQVGKYLRVTISYTDGGGYNNTVSSTATTAAVANVNDAPSGTVSVNGPNNAAADYTQNAVLKASNNLTDADGMGTVAYQWQRSADGSSWTDINNANTDSYTLTQADVGKYVHARATYTDLHGTAETADSSKGNLVANVNDAPTGGVTVTGNMTQGTVLQADNTLADADGLGMVSYQWQISNDNSQWSDIAGATGNSFTLTQSQTGQYVRVKASYTDGQRTVETVFSDTSSNTMVLDVMDAPVLTLTIANQTFKEASGAAQQANAVSGLFTNVSLSDAENNNISSITFTVSGLKDGADENLVVAGSNLSLVTAAAGAPLSGSISYSSSVSGGVATVTLTKTGGWTLAEAQTLIGGIGYKNTKTDDPTAGVRSISLLQLVDDGTLIAPEDKNTADFSAANSNAITATVSVQGVNDAPVLSGSSNPTYTENGPAFNVNSNINVSDVDSTKLVSAKVTIASGYVTGDTLSLPAGLSGIGDISASVFNASTHTLTLTSASGATLAEWQTALRAVQFSSSSDTPGTSRSIDFVVNDGTDNSALATTTVTVTPVNDIPVLSNASSNLAYTENATTVINAGVTVSDPDNAVPVKVTVAFTNGSFVNAEDRLLFNTNSNYGNISAVWDGTAGTLTLTSSGNAATLSQWNAAMQAVKYQNLSDAPSTANRSISFTANDGTDDSLAAITTVSVTAINDAPVLAAVSKTAVYTEPTGTGGASPVIVFGSGALTLTDAENNSIKAFSLNITGVSDSTEVLNIDGSDVALIAGRSGTTTGGSAFDFSVTYSVPQAAFTVTFSKTSNFVDIGTFKSLLEGMTYNNTNANNPTSGNRVISVASVQDSAGGSDTYTSSAASVAQSTVTVTATNDAPVNTVPAGTVSVGYNSSIYITGLGVSDVDAGAATSFSVKLSVNQGSLSLGLYNGVTVTNNNSPTVTLSGKVADINSLLASANAVKYTTPAGNGGSYTLTMTSNDPGNSGTGAGIDVVSTVTIAENQPPVLGGNSTPLGYTENATAAPLFTNLTVTDADNTTLASAKVTISNFVSTEDVLGFTNTGTSNMGNIVGNFDNQTGVMSLSSLGSIATLAQWQAALRAVTYRNSSDNPSTTMRNIRVTINDGSADSTAATNTVTVTAVNDAPTLLSTTATLTAINEDTAALTGASVSALFASNFSDIDAGNTLAGVAITANAATSAQGKWQWLNASTWTDIATSGLADATALYLAANTTLRFVPATNFNGTPGALTARLVDSSATGLTNGSSVDASTNGTTTAYSSGTVALSTSITAVNDAPSFTNGPGSTSISIGGGTNYSLPTGYSVTDPDAGTGNMQISFTLQESGNATGTLTPNYGASGVTFVSSTSNVYTFQGTMTQLNSWLSTANYLTYQPTNGFVGTATIAMNINDMGKSGSGTPLNANAAYPLSLTVTDATPPALSTAVTSADGSTITLTYNEALLTTATAPVASFTYKIGSTSYSPNSVSYTGNTVVLTLPTKPVFGDTVKVTYSAPNSDSNNTNAAVQDITGNDAASLNDTSVTNNVSNTPPSLSTTSVKNTIAPSAFAVNGLTSNVTATNVNGATVELTLAAGVNLSSDITLTYTAPPDTNKTIQDSTGNDAGNISSAITVPAGGTYTAPSETVAPTLISATLNAARDTVILTYSESLYTGTAPGKAKFMVTAGVDSNSFNMQTINSVQVNAANPHTVEVKLASAIAANLPFVTVSYTNTSDATLYNTTSVQDPTGNDAAAYNRLLVPTTNTDMVAPVLRSVTSSSVSGTNKLILTYSEPLNNFSNFTEGSGAAAQAPSVPVFNAATVNPGTGEASQTITGLTFTVSGLADGANEKISVDGTTITLGAGSSGNTTNTISYSVTITGTTATVTLSKASGITAAQAQALITGITYQNTNVDNPTPGLRTFDITSLTDSSGSANATATFSAGTNSASVLVTALNDGPVFSSNTAPTGLTTTNSQAPSKALAINTRGYALSDADGGNTIEALSFGIGDITIPASSNSTNTLAPLNFNFPNKPSSLYLSVTSDKTYTVNGTVSDLNAWLQLSNSVTYNPRSSYTGMTYSANFKIVDSFGGVYNSSPFTVSVSADTVAPVFKTAVVSTEDPLKVILSYDEPLNTTNVPLPSAFTVGNATPSSLAVVGTNVVLTMASAVAAGATVAYTPPVSGTAAIQDAVGNKALSVSTTTPATADTAAPVLDSSLVFYNGNNGVNKFVLYFNEEMASSTTPPGTNGPLNTGFNISIVDPLIPDRTGGASIAWVQSGGSSSFTEKAFAISFVLGYLSTSASVQMKYVDPGNGYPNALKDLAGNHAGNMVLGAWTNDNLSAVDAAFTSGKSVQVVGGQGNDTMTGGAANDTFAWFAGDAGTTTGAVDIVKSFTAWNGTAGDKLDISKLLTNGYVSGTSTLSQWVTSVTNNASGAPSGVGTTNTKIVIDVDGTGSGTVTQTIWLDGVNLSSIDPAVLKSNGILIA